MPTPSKFTKDVRTKILQALQVGCGRNTAAAVAGVSDATLRRWLIEGKDAVGTSGKHQFYEAVLEAEAHPKARALGIIYRAMEDKPDLAWRFIERRESGFAPPIAAPQAVGAPTIINLNLSDGAPALATTVIEVPEVPDVQQEEPEAAALPDPSEPT